MRFSFTISSLSRPHNTTVSKLVSAPDYASALQELGLGVRILEDGRTGVFVFQDSDDFGMVTVSCEVDPLETPQGKLALLEFNTHKEKRLSEDLAALNKIVSRVGFQVVLDRLASKAE